MSEANLLLLIGIVIPYGVMAAFIIYLLVHS